MKGPVLLGSGAFFCLDKAQTNRTLLVVSALDPRQLPSDPQVLREMVLALSAQLEEHERRLARVQHIMEQLLAWRFGSRRERVVDERQLFLFAVEFEAQGGDIDRLIKELIPEEERKENPLLALAEEKPRNKQGHGRKPLPSSLQRERIEYELNEAERACPQCAKPMTKIGEDVSERLEYVPASLRVIEEARAKYGCHCGGCIKTAPKPGMPIAKSTAGPSLLAQVVVSKYLDHCPLHRQEGIFRRHGVELSRKTMCGWMKQTADALRPLYERLKQEVLSSKTVQTDDTPVAVLDRKLPRTRKGRFWTYVGQRATVYDYTPTRKRTGPEKFLEPYHGYLQADAYAGYDALFKESERGLVEVACWAHARRKFYEARGSDLSCAMTVVAFIGLLYRIERKTRNWSSAERQARRQRWAKPVLETLYELLVRQRDRVLPKSPEGMAINYTLGNWAALCRYIEDGDLAIDNNGAERSLRGVVVGRQNWLFFGSDGGGETAAVLRSFLVSCQQAGIEPYSYMCDVLRRIADFPIQRIAELLPMNWKTAEA